MTVDHHTIYVQLTLHSNKECNAVLTPSVFLDLQFPHARYSFEMITHQ